MKSGLLPLFAAAALFSTLAGARADSDITFQDFYDALSPDGDWVELDDYGYCWRPFVDDHWRPYTDGQWVYTEAGYTWFSNEPWGWAVYHYGRWTKVTNWGWVWVPGYEWGPAWVSWRTNDDYIGWAALPPEAVWEASAGFGVFVDVDYGIGPDWYAFCPVAYFGAPRLRTVCLPWRGNVNIFNTTVNITRIRNVNNVIIFNDGPDIAVVNRRAETPIRRVRLEREGNFEIAALREGRLKDRLEGDALKIPAPRVAKQDATPVKIAGRASRSQINRGWEIAEKNPQLAAEIRNKIREDAGRSGRPMTAETPAQIQQQPPRNIIRQERQPEREATRPPTPTPADMQERNRDRRENLPPSDTVSQQERKEELRNRILQQQQAAQEALRAERSRQQQQEQAQQQQIQQHQQQQEQQAGEAARQQRAAELREKALRAQKEAAERQQQETATRQQQQQEQNQRQQQIQQQIQQQRDQLQQNRQQRQQQRQDRTD